MGADAAGYSRFERADIDVVASLSVLFHLSLFIHQQLSLEGIST